MLYKRIIRKNVNKLRGERKNPEVKRKKITQNYYCESFRKGKLVKYLIIAIIIRQ